MLNRIPSSFMDFEEEPIPFYEGTTHNVRITVVPEYLEEKMYEGKLSHVWAYHIQIKKLGDETIQLLNRHWIITDSKGKVEEVKGAGVIGEQPVLEEGDEFCYSSGTYLATDSGIMMGSYEMCSQDGDHFDVDIPAFSLDIPGKTIVKH